MYLYDADNNSITCNGVQNNLQGFYLTGGSTDNTIEHNNIIKNGAGVFPTLTPMHTQKHASTTKGLQDIQHTSTLTHDVNTKTGCGGWQFYIAQCQNVEAKHNYWGAGMNNSTIDASIHDNEEESGWGEVEFYPFETEPVSCAPTWDEPPAFTPIDAAIALQIAVGNLPPDLRWDVSGDGSVTSLDALMILQAA